MIQEAEQIDTGNGAALGIDIVARIECALSQSSVADIVRIARQAAYLAGGTPDNDGRDLFNEAIARTLDGSRNWPVGLPFRVFIYGAMKSIAHGQRNTKQVECEALESDLSVDDENRSDGFFGSLPGARGTDEVLVERADRLAKEAMLEELRKHVKGDENVELVLAALEDGTPRRVLIEEFGMTTVEYESARKKLRRCADVLFRGRRKA